jgi:hypothetical protein
MENSPEYGEFSSPQFYSGVDQFKNVLGDIPILGWETYGEICMEPGQFSGFHNTTSVVVLIPA